uniref:Topoisomerase II-associated protein n=1 Tax=Pithovirus LCPAC201 TaxID=2506591 RepID=A0A481Z4G9_9VIRU|nr:MAG: topoisomerase II-associated protein [Pithovirus LCPAC201]
MASELSPKPRSIDEIITESVGPPKTRKSKRGSSSRKRNKHTSKQRKSYILRGSQNVRPMNISDLTIDVSKRKGSGQNPKIHKSDKIIPSDRNSPRLGNSRPLSPRDHTPITISGKVIPRENFGNISDFKHLPNRLKIISTKTPPVDSATNLKDSWNTPSRSDGNFDKTISPVLKNERENSPFLTILDDNRTKEHTKSFLEKGTSSSIPKELTEINLLTHQQNSQTSIPKYKNLPPNFVDIDSEEKFVDQHPGSPRQNKHIVLKPKIVKNETVPNFTRFTNESILKRVISPRNILTPSFESPPSPPIRNISSIRSNRSAPVSQETFPSQNDGPHIKRINDSIFTDPTESLPQFNLVKSPSFRSLKEKGSDNYSKSDDLVICPAPQPVIATRQSLIIPKVPSVKPIERILDQVRHDVFSPYPGSPLVAYPQPHHYPPRTASYPPQKSYNSERTSYSQSVPHSFSWKEKINRDQSTSNRQQSVPSLNVPYNQTIPYTQDTPYSQSTPNTQATPYSQATPYTQATPYSHATPYTQATPYSRSEIYSTAVSPYYPLKSTTNKNFSHITNNKIETAGPIFIPIISPVVSKNVQTEWGKNQNPIFIPFGSESSNIISPNQYPPSMSVYPEHQSNFNREPQLGMIKQYDRQDIYFTQNGINPEKNIIEIPKSSHSFRDNQGTGQINRSVSNPYPYSAFPPPPLIFKERDNSHEIRESPTVPSQNDGVLSNSKNFEELPSAYLPNRDASQSIRGGLISADLPISPKHNYYHENIPSPTFSPQKSSRREEIYHPLDHKAEESTNTEPSNVSRESSSDQEEIENGDQNTDKSTKPTKGEDESKNNLPKNSPPEDNKWRGKTLDIKPPIYANKPDYDQMSPMDQARYRGQFNVLFGMLRERYPHYNIPNFPDDVSLDVMHGYYESYHFHFSIRDTVDKWKLALICVWFGIELLFTKGLGLNLGGYGMNQVSMMATYERLLYEFVEKGRGNIGAGLSPEVKILLLTVVSAVVFLIIKYISDWMGPMAGNLIQSLVNNLISGGPSQAGTSHVANTINNNLPQVSPDTGNVPQQPVPQIPSFLGGINIANIVQSFSGMFGGNRSGGSGNSNPPPRRRARRRPVYDS